MSQDIAFWQIQKGIPDPQLMNSYSYSRNNPLTYVDPNGEWPTLAQVNAFLNKTEKYNPLNYLYGSSADKIADGLYTGNYRQAAVGAVEVVATTALVVDTALSIGMGSGSLYAYRQSITPGVVGPKALPSSSKPAALSASPSGQTRFLHNVEVDDYGRISKGTVDLKPTFDRVQTGRVYSQYRNDGSTYANDGRGGSAMLPRANDPNYYTEHVIPTPGITGRPGPQRLITGRGGEAYYTSNHYRSFTQVRGQAGSQ